MENPEKLFYSIREVAEMFQVNASLIRFWEKEFSIIKPQKNKKGNRLFTKKDIESFRKIFHLVKEKGYTLQGAKEQLKLKSKTESEITTNWNKVELLSKLKSVKEELFKLGQRIDEEKEI